MVFGICRIAEISGRPGGMDTSCVSGSYGSHDFIAALLPMAFSLFLKRGQAVLYRKQGSLFLSFRK